MSLPLLQAIHACGESLCAALEAGEVSDVVRLAAERQALVDELLTAPPPAPMPDAWTERGHALAVQDRRLAGLLAERERELAGAVAQASQHRKAHASYEPPSPSSGRLHAVHG